MNVKILEKCPACDGSGEIRPSILLIDDIENNLAYLLREQNERKLTLTVGPFIYAYIRKNSLRWKWLLKFRKRIRVKEVKAHHFLEFHFFNREGNEIKI
jgi:ribonuclease G